MARSREGKDDEYYKGIIRQQRAEIKRLKRLIRQHEKEIMLIHYGEGQSDAEDLFEVKETTRNCPDCKIGLIEEVVVVGRHFQRCLNCAYRTKAKRLNE